MGNNLGGYINIVKAAKKIGGPAYLIAGVALAGYGVVRLGEVGVRAGVRNGTKIIDGLKLRWANPVDLDALPIYRALVSADLGSGCRIVEGDEFRVLQLMPAADGVMIEWPLGSAVAYSVSVTRLIEVSTFTLGDHPA
jgi:hypothetical protein